jgi:LPS export ABC transporter protein LptC
MRKHRRFILLLAIFLSLGGVGYKVAQTIWMQKLREIRNNPLKALDYLPEAALKMKDFHRAKIEDGRKVWEIFGDEANYLKDQKEAIIKKPRFYYYDKSGETVETTGEVAHIFLNENELEKLQLQGEIQVTYKGYVLKSEEAIYFPGKQRITLPTPTTIISNGIELHGSSMEVELEDKKIRLVRDVKTKLEPDKMGKNDLNNNRNRAVGG